jgi:TonB family protein
VFWFNPVLWLACARLRHESERACDDVVLAAGVDGATYATELLELARLLAADHRSWFPVPAMTGRASGLERRINAMFDTRLRRAPLTRAARCGVLAGFAALALPLAALAQASFGSLSGTVTDQMNRVLPDAAVTVVDDQQHASHTVHTDRSGRFQLVGLVPGTYRVETAVPGFQPQSTAVTVSGEPVERNLTLQLGSLQETMTVTGQSGPAHVSAGIPPRAMPSCKADSTIGGNIRAPRKIRDARPAYTGTDGVVTLAAVIAPDGSVGDVHVVKSASPALEAPAIDAVSQWQYDSTLLNCVPVPVTMNITMVFRQQ